MQMQTSFIHHVFFWLKENNENNRRQLIEGLQKLSATTTIKQFHIGVPANTNRDVVENTYSVSWMIFFDSAADQDSYQIDPIHLNFVKECSHLWTRVTVFDCVNA
jgi:hypothetical protein